MSSPLQTLLDVLDKVTREKEALSQQLMLYHDFIRAVFLGT
jgi:hypothetical protein